MIYGLKQVGQYFKVDIYSLSLPWRRLPFLPADVFVFALFYGQVRKIPVTQNLDIIPFLVDIGTIGDWNMQGLPTDPLSIQNGILVTRSSR